jgi:copper transporter 1
MLWNWNTVDSCFLSSSWHVRSNGMFAGSVIGVFLLCMAIEGVRRLGREYDRKITAQAMVSLHPILKP